MVLGFDKMTLMMGSAPNPQDMEDAILPAAFFAMWATRRMHERGTKPEHLAAIAAKNWNNGALNPMSQRQADRAGHGREGAGRSAWSPWPLTTMMSCPIGDGAACAIVGRADLAKKLQPGPAGGPHRGVASRQREVRARPSLHGPGRRTGADEPRRRRRISTSRPASGPKDIDLVQVHDAFAIEELEYYELLGFCGEGEAEACIERGDFGPADASRSRPTAA